SSSVYYFPTRRSSGLVLVHLFTAILQLVFWRKTITHRVLSILGSAVGLGLAFNLFVKVFNGGILTMNAANWEAPFGIVFVADLRSEEHTSELQSRENL